MSTMTAENHISKESEETILDFERTYTYKLQDIPIIELSTDYYEDMQLLNDKVRWKAG